MNERNYSEYREDQKHRAKERERMLTERYWINVLFDRDIQLPLLVPLSSLCPSLSVLLLLLLLILSLV